VTASPLDDLIDDVKRRPTPYAAVAAVGVAGALLLAARANTPGHGSTIDRLGATADRLEARTRQNAGVSLDKARDTMTEGIDALREHLPEPVREQLLGYLPDAVRGPLREHLRPPTITERTKQAAANVGVTQSTAAVFVGTLLTKAITTWLGARAGQHAADVSSGWSSEKETDLNHRLNALNERELRAIARDRGVENVDDQDKPALIASLAHT